MSFKRKLAVIFCALVLLTLPTPGASAFAGGTLAGTVTDPKGAVVVGAKVTVLDAATNQPRTTVETDAQGKFKIEGLPAGTYIVIVTSKNFSEARRESLGVVEGKTTSADVRLELAPLEAGTVQVSAAGLKANSDPVYVQLRQRGARAEDFTGGQVYSVNNLVLKRDAATFTLTGELYFLLPVEGRTVGAVFIGNGEMTLAPPTEAERRSLAIFTEQPTLTEAFSHLVLRFTDKTLEEIKASPQASPQTNAGQAERARELYGNTQALLRKRGSDFSLDMRYNLEMRTLVDLYAAERPGFFLAFIGGNRYKKLIYQFDPLGVPGLAPEEVALMSYGESDWGYWTAFHKASEYANNSASSSENNRLYNITHHEIDGAIKGTQIAASDRITLFPMRRGVRVLPFDLYRSLRVSRVQDEEGRDLNFIQEDKDADADFAVILPQELALGKPYKLTVQYQGGDALRDSGGGNFILLPRSTWYPNNAGMQFGDRATFDMTFRYPKGNLFVGTGAPLAEDAREGDIMVAKWSSGETELAVAGFNYGRFKKKAAADAESGYQIEFYANTEVPDALKAMQHNIAEAERQGAQTETTLGVISTTKMADAAIADTQNATRLYNAYFGKLPYTRIAMTQQPAAGFGQAWPTLVFMPYTAFMDTTQRTQLMGVRGGTDTFWKYVGPHEVAHQWWGHMIGWRSYRDQWMSEGFAEFSTSLYALYVGKDVNKFIDFWEDQRQRIVQARPQTNNRKPYTVGGVTQGFRLSSGKTAGTYQFLVYPKGAYILHMLRMMMYEGGDQQFQTMMKDFVQTNFNKDVSTEDFKHAVEKHMTPRMKEFGGGNMDWFFNQWVYGTEMPSYRFEYQINGNTISGRITQSGVSDDFRMIVPIYLDFGKGWARLGQANIIGNATIELNNIQLPQAPKRAALCALKDVLALNVENIKK